MIPANLLNSQSELLLLLEINQLFSKFLNVHSCLSSLCFAVTLCQHTSQAVTSPQLHNQCICVYQCLGILKCEEWFILREMRETEGDSFGLSLFEGVNGLFQLVVVSVRVVATEDRKVLACQGEEDIE